MIGPTLPTTLNVKSTFSTTWLSQGRAVLFFANRLQGLYCKPDPLRPMLTRMTTTTPTTIATPMGKTSLFPRRVCTFACFALFHRTNQPNSRRFLLSRVAESCSRCCWCRCILQVRPLSRRRELHLSFDQTIPNPSVTMGVSQQAAPLLVCRCSVRLPGYQRSKEATCASI